MMSPSSIVGGVVVTAILLVALYFGTRPAAVEQLAVASPAPPAVVATISREDADRR